MERAVGVIGLGIMGSAMMRNLLKDGFSVVGYDVAPPATRALEEAGGAAAASPRDVAEQAAVVITSLPTGTAFQAVMTGPDGVAAAAGSGQVVIDTCTLPVELKRAAHDALAQRGKILLDCPVSGTGAQAVRKDLVVFGSGDRAAFERVRPVLQGISRSQKYLGAFGNGSKMKFVANLLVNIHNTAAAEALVLGMKAGLAPQLVYETLQDSAATSRMLQVRGPLMVAGEYDAPTATVDLQLKDLAIIGQFAADLRCPTPLFTLAAQLYLGAKAQGRGGQDTAAICAVLERMAAVERS